MDGRGRAAVAAVTVVFVALGASPVMAAGASPPAVASPGPAASASADASSVGTTARMFVAGTDVVGPPVWLSAELPAGWDPFEFGARTGDVPTGANVFATIVDDTFGDPCVHVPREPKIGTSVEAAASALAAIPDVTVSPPTPTTIAGHEATSLVITIPASLPCAPDEFYLWQDSPDSDYWALAPNEVIRVWILDMAGRPVAIAARSYPGTSDGTKAEQQAVLDSIVFDPAPSAPAVSPAAS